jgi:hypothetical protein
VTKLELSIVVVPAKERLPEIAMGTASALKAKPETARMRLAILGGERFFFMCLFFDFLFDEYSLYFFLFLNS